MRRHASEAYREIDEYLWPLTGVTEPVSWETLAENLPIRNRLAESRAHVSEVHVQPWLQTLREPIPRASCDEWNKLAERLRDIEMQCDSALAALR